MRLIFLYVADRQAKLGSKHPWDRDRISENFFTTTLPTQGYFALLEAMLDEGTIDDILIFIESAVSPGRFSHGKIHGYVIPEMSYIYDFIQPNDIIWCRGGFRSWFPFLSDMAERNHWTICYAANTGRQKWKFWHIILNDLTEGYWIDSTQRFHFFFRKPINPKVFYYIRGIKRPFDICIGASHIHDKKGQWKGIRTLIEYRRIFGKNLKAILPGRILRGTYTNHILDNIKHHSLDVTLPGMLPNHDMVNVYNQSKLFVYFGGHGQNDRGPLEALCCGTPVMISAPDRHSPMFTKNDRVARVLSDSADPTTCAYEIHTFLNEIDEERKTEAHDFFVSQNGFYGRVLPDMTMLFGILRQYPTAFRWPSELRKLCTQ